MCKRRLWPITARRREERPGRERKMAGYGKGKGKRTEAGGAGPHRLRCKVNLIKAAKGVRVLINFKWAHIDHARKDKCFSAGGTKGEALAKAGKGAPGPEFMPMGLLACEEIWGDASDAFRFSPALPSEAGPWRD